MASIQVVSYIVVILVADCFFRVRYFWTRFFDGDSKMVLLTVSRFNLATNLLACGDALTIHCRTDGDCSIVKVADVVLTAGEAMVSVCGLPEYLLGEH